MLTQFIEAILEFMEAGGWVLELIFWLIMLMWLLILERALYYFIWHKRAKNEAIANWGARTDKSSWNAEQIRQMWISKLHLALNSSVTVIQALVALCPLLGLMGTVTGMIQVFDVMAIAGSGDARSMAAGVSSATIPTMAGMVGALSGVFASTWLKRIVKQERTHIEEALELDRHR